MKKVLTLIISGLMFLVFIGCDTGSVGSNPVNPAEPVETPLAVGNLILTLDDPGVDLEGESGSPRAVITGASSSGATFSEELSLDDSTGNTLTVENLLAGDWNVKVIVWENASLEMTTAAAFETVIIADGVDTVLSPALFTFDNMDSALATLYESYTIPVQTKTAFPRYNLSMSLWVLMTGYEEMADPDSLEGVLQFLLLNISQDSDTSQLLSDLIALLEEYDEELEATYLEYFFPGVDLEASEFVDLYEDMIEKVFTDFIGDYEFLFYDFIDVTLASSTEGFAPSGFLPDVDSVSFSAASGYDSLPGFSYVWYLNGAQVSTGAAYDMAAVDCVDDLNYLSVQLIYSADGVSVILGSDSVVFYRESGGERMTISEIPFASVELRNVVASLTDADGAPLVYADEVTRLRVRNYQGISLEGLQFLENLKVLELINLGLTDTDDIAPILLLENLTRLSVAINPLTAEAMNLLNKTFDFGVEY